MSAIGGTIASRAVIAVASIAISSALVWYLGSGAFSDQLRGGVGEVVERGQVRERADELKRERGLSRVEALDLARAEADGSRASAEAPRPDAGEISESRRSLLSWLGGSSAASPRVSGGPRGSDPGRGRGLDPARGPDLAPRQQAALRPPPASPYRVEEASPFGSSASTKAGIRPSWSLVGAGGLRAALFGGRAVCDPRPRRRGAPAIHARRRAASPRCRHLAPRGHLPAHLDRGGRRRAALVSAGHPIEKALPLRPEAPDDPRGRARSNCPRGGDDRHARHPAREARGAGERSDHPRPRPGALRPLAAGADPDLGGRARRGGFDGTLGARRARARGRRRVAGLSSALLRGHPDRREPARSRPGPGRDDPRWHAR